jgi:type III secretion protein D
VLLMLVPIALLLWAVWSVALSPAPRDTAIVAPVPPATAPQRQRDAAIAVVQSLKLEQRVRVSEGTNGKVAVQAALLDDDEYEALAMGLSRLNPRPALSVVREQDLQAAVAEAVAREAADIGSPLSVASLGRGKFRIEGNVADTTARDALLARLRQGLPSLIVLESALATREDRALRLLADLRAAGIGDIQGRFADGQLRVEALLSAADVPRWEQALVRIAQRYSGVPFEASTRLTAPEATTRLPAVLATLPFKLRTVVSGPASYVVLNDGAKLMIGGSHQGWRLVAVDPDQVMFEGQAGRRALVPR